MGRPKWEIADEKLKKELIHEMHAADEKLKNELLQEMRLADERLERRIMGAINELKEIIVAGFAEQAKFNKMLLELPTIKKELKELKTKR